MHGRSKKTAHDKNLLNAIDAKVIFCELLKTGTINDGFSCSNFSDPINFKRSENSNAGEKMFFCFILFVLVYPL